MQRIALRIAYEGLSFQGWQTQPGGRAAQDVLERALATVAGHPVATICAGRTDAGVHALAQVVHFDTGALRPETAWTRGVNANLPEGIAVQQMDRVDASFHARFGAVQRRYRYLILRSAAAHLTGQHDFSAFRSSQCQARSPVRTLSLLELTEQAELLCIDVQANAFLHHMVRNLVGALVWVGMGRRPADWAAQVLLSRDRRQAAPTMPAQGLYLTGVQYGLPNDLGCWPALSVP